MKIVEIYKKYKIMPTLAEHQLRVAAVARLIGQKLGLIADLQNITVACLLHDMGNILKFDLRKSKSLLNLDLDLNYWQSVKDEYAKKYGTNEHQASMIIAKELGANARVLELIDCVGFAQAEANLKTSDTAKKICAYSDMRVGPFGVISLKDRFADLRRRYEAKKAAASAEGMRLKFEAALGGIEKQIFFGRGIKPGDITEAAIGRFVVELRSWNL